MENKTNSIESLNLFFRERADIPNIFNHPNLTSRLLSKLVVGSMWHQFSEFMPAFLNTAASKVSSTDERKRIKQIAYEEMGEGNLEKRHSKTFLEAVSLSQDSNINWEIAILKQKPDLKGLLENLITKIKNADDQNYVLGMCLGMEIPANENIEALFQAVKYDMAENDLEDTEFFKVHRENEDEHIELNLKSYLSINGAERKEIFLKGFDDAISFWKKFWKEASTQIRHIEWA